MEEQTYKKKKNAFLLPFIITHSCHLTVNLFWVRINSQFFPRFIDFFHISQASCLCEYLRMFQIIFQEINYLNLGVALCISLPARLQSSLLFWHGNLRRIDSTGKVGCVVGEWEWNEGIEGDSRSFACLLCFLHFFFHFVSSLLCKFERFLPNGQQAASLPRHFSCFDWLTDQFDSIQSIPLPVCLCDCVSQNSYSLCNVSVKQKDEDDLARQKGEEEGSREVKEWRKRKEWR